jgi:hypothetical protein
VWYTGRYTVLPDGRARHPACPVTCDKPGCGRATTQPVFFKDIPGGVGSLSLGERACAYSFCAGMSLPAVLASTGTFCSKACGLESDPDALRCSVCLAVFTGGEHAFAPDGTRRHMLCAVTCDACGGKTTRPLYFKSFGVSFSPQCVVATGPSRSLDSRVHAARLPRPCLAVQGAYCSSACGQRSDPSAVPCYICGRVITGVYAIESTGPKVGCRKHPQCIPTRRLLAHAGSRR